MVGFFPWLFLALLELCVASVGSFVCSRYGCWPWFGSWHSRLFCTRRFCGNVGLPRVYSFPWRCWLWSDCRSYGGAMWPVGGRKKKRICILMQWYFLSLYFFSGCRP